MRIRRSFRKKPMTRPRKRPGERRRREMNQRRRLLDLGVSEEVVGHLNTKQVRELLQRPEKLKKKLAQKSET